MAIIYSYPLVTSIQPSDLLILSVDNSELPTRQVTVGDLLASGAVDVNLNFTADTGTGSVNLSTQSLEVRQGVYITTTATNQELIINHKSTVRQDTNIGDTSPGYGGSFTVIDSVVTDATGSGHVTGVNLKTVTLPAADDTNTTYDLLGYNTGIELVGSDGTRDQIQIVGSGDTTVSQANNIITVSSTSGAGGSGTANYLPRWTDADTLGDSGFYQANLPGVPLDKAIGLNTTKLDSVFGERPDLRIASRETNDPGVLDLFRPDGDVQAGDRVGVLQYSLDDDNQYTVAQVEVKTIGDSGSYNGGGGKLYFKTSANVTAANPDVRLSIDNLEADFSVPINVTDTNQSSFAGQVTIPETPVAGTDAASKAYVDAQNTGQVSGSGTTSTLPIWSDGPNGVLGDSPLTNPSFNDLETAGSLQLGQYKNLTFGNVSNSDNFIINNSISGSTIRQSGSGNLLIQCETNIELKAAAALGGTESLAKFSENGPIELYYDNVKTFETTSTGITVTGAQSSFTGQVTIPETPVANTDAASKGYVDSQSGGGGVGGSGTVSTIPIWSTTTDLADSQITDDGTDVSISSGRNFNALRNFGSNEFNAKIDVGSGLNAGSVALDVRQKAYVRSGMVISPNPTNVDVDNSSLVIGSGANDIVEGSDHCLAVGSGNQILDDSDRSVSFGNNNESVQSDNSMNVGNTNILKYSNNSHIIGQNNQMGDEYPSNTSGFNNSLIIGSDNLLLTDDGSAAPSNGALSFVIGHDNELRHTLQNSFSFGYSISNLGLSSTPHRNDFNIGGDLVGVNQTMTLGYRNDTTLYPTIDRNNGLGETKFVVAVGSSTTTNANALLITEGGISGGGGGTVPMIPRVLLPTVTGFSASNDAAADGLGIPQGALYQNNGILQINRGGGSAVDPLSSYVLKSGDTMTGNLTMNNSQIQITDSGTQARMSINNTGTGDPQINFQLSGSSKFTIGVDNSDGDKFKISGSSALGSNDRIVVNSSGNVGIGTTSPQQKLDVNGNFRINTNNLTLSNTPAWGVPTQNIIGAEDNTNGATLTLMNTSATIPANGVSGTLQFVALDDGRNTGGSGYATASISAVSKLAPGSGQSGQGALVFKTGGYYSNITEKMRIDGLSGNVGIGTTNPVYQLQLSLNSAAKPTSSAWTVVSDERVKTNIRPYETGLQELLQIEPKLFDYNGKAGFDAKTKNNIGVIAQEIKDIMPETVKKYNAKLNEEDKEDTELYNFDSHALTFALINSVKELNAKIKNLETKIQTLENQ